MPTFEIFNLPDAGEGLTQADIITWLVAVGDTVEVNQAIVEIETAKSLVELPSPYDGVIAELLVAEGETVDVGAPIVKFEVAGTDSGAPAEEDPLRFSLLPPAPPPVARTSQTLPPPSLRRPLPSLPLACPPGPRPSRPQRLSRPQHPMQP